MAPNPSTESKAVNRVLDLLALAAAPDPPFPPSEMFSEGWMLRLLMDAHQQGHVTLPVPTVNGTRWFSEARLLSPFQRSPGATYKLHETPTRGDGVIADFTIRSGTTAGLELQSTRQFVLIEAKMGSSLAPGTKYAPGYDQAVRNVAAMAWTVFESGLPIENFESLAFLLVAPQRQFDERPNFALWTSKESLAAKFNARVEAYREVHLERHATLITFAEQVFEPMLDKLQIGLWSWESAIAGVEDKDLSGDLEEFYRLCRLHAALEHLSSS